MRRVAPFRDLFVLAPVIALLASATPAGAVALARTEARVAGESVRLGELFTDLPNGVDPRMAVMPAPAPGRELVLDAAKLQAIARAHGIDWRPIGIEDQISVTRAAIELDRDALTGLLRPALEARGLPADAEITLEGALPRIAVADGAQNAPRVEDIVWSPGQPRFSAQLSANGETTQIIGRVAATVMVPVPARAIGAGEIIRERDLAWMRMRADRASQAFVGDPSRLIGRTARRALAAQSPVRINDITATLLVTRNAEVSVRVQTGQMSLVMTGKALDDGAEGDTVRVLNTRSNKTIQGQVSAAGVVTVASTYPVAAN